MAQDWNIKRRSAACSRCECAFADGETCFSALRDGEAGFERSDYCEKCWGHPESQDGLFSSWAGEFQAPEPEAPEVLKRETAESLLRRLIEEADPEFENVVYILAVMLERKRLLIERDVRKLEDGSPLRVYERRKTGETFLVHDPQLELDALTHVQEQVAAMLGTREEDEQAQAASASAQSGDSGASSESVASEQHGAPTPVDETGADEAHDG